MKYIKITCHLYEYNIQYNICLNMIFNTSINNNFTLIIQITEV